MIKKLVILFLSLFIAISLFSTVLISDVSLSNFGLSGRISHTGRVMLTILGGEVHLNITSPRNITYNFTKVDRANNNYTLPLNVTSNVVIEEWWYNLIDLRHNEVINSSASFTPNTTINAVRWRNKLDVFGNNSDGVTFNDSVQFFVYVPNSAPEVLNLSDEYFTCENDNFKEIFYVRDVDEDQMQLYMSPYGTFYTFPSFIQAGDVISEVELFSGMLEKGEIGSYEITISAKDFYNSTCCVDSATTNITVIEINNEPEMEDVGVQTIWTKGDNSTFYEVVNLSDVEDGSRNSSNITFNISFLNSDKLFNISDNGVMYFEPNESDIGVYNITISSTDSGIDNPHSRIMEFCNQTGDPITVYDNFSLTVTNRNRPPTITSYYPDNLTLNVRGTDKLYFNISKYDPDGTVPDAYWYVGNSLKEYDSGSLNDEFSHSFGCGVGGTYVIRVVITDGLLNDSISWLVDVSKVPCPEPEQPGPGGAFGVFCDEKWVCEDWHTCQSAEFSLERGNLSREDYRNVIDNCSKQGVDMRHCGVQIRDCKDMNKCNTTFSKPASVRSCYFLREPSCYDGIKNCHDGACEILIDCGGPCKPCPTCSDNIQNQGEEGVDCGGPCPEPCPIEIPFKEKVLRMLLVFGLILILIIVIIVEILRIRRIKKKINKDK